jgi:hypothetical protein
VFKRLTLAAGDSSGDSPTGSDTASQESELRLRRSLEMLSGGARREPSEHGFKPAAHAPNNPRRHRFKDDGEVPVVHVAGHRDRSLPPGATPAPHRPPHQTDPHAAEDRAARERAERALEAAKETIRQLQTHAGHAELALREAVGQAEAQQQAMASLRSELAACQADLAQARAAAARAEAARVEAEAEAAEEFERQRLEQAALEDELRQLRLERRKAEKAAAQRAAVPADAPRKPPAIRRKAAAPTVPEVEEEPVKWWLPSEKKPVAAGRSRR